MTAPKPPIPGAGELRAIRAKECDVHASCAAGDAVLWLAGYHARDVELELAQYSAEQRGQTVLVQMKHIAKLEAEVAELKRCCEEWAANYDDVDEERKTAIAEVAELRSLETRLREQLAKSSDEYMRAIDRQQGEIEHLRRSLAEVPYRKETPEAWKNGYKTGYGAAPRRTPDLTERVAEFLHEDIRDILENCKDDEPEPPWDELDAFDRGQAIAHARRYLDLVFGKEQK